MQATFARVTLDLGDNEVTVPGKPLSVAVLPGERLVSLWILRPADAPEQRRTFRVVSGGQHADDVTCRGEHIGMVVVAEPGFRGTTVHALHVFDVTAAK
jgi:hypothetical protein